MVIMARVPLILFIPLHNGYDSPRPINIIYSPTQWLLWPASH